jgi:hypothetical protein
VTRLLPAGERIAMQVDGAGLPVCLTWRGETHPVEQIANHWRLDMGWWHFRLWRDYYKLTTVTGLLVEVYSNRVDDAWYVQRLYD